jgi:AsmA protein
MPRRRVLVAAFAGFAVLGLAVAPWTVNTGRLSAAVAKQLRTAYGLGFAVKGRTTIALLPTPRLKFENVVLANRDGATLVESGQLRGELRLLPMLIGRFEMTELSLNEARIQVDVDANGESPWDRLLAYQRDRIGAREGGRQVRRLIVTNSKLALSDRRRSFQTELADMNFVGNWPAIDAPVELTGSARWRDEPVQITLSGLRPATLLAGMKSRFDLDASSAMGRVAVQMELSLADGPQGVGRANLTTRSLRDLVQWGGVELPFATLIQSASLAGDFTLDRNVVSWPALALTLGSDRLDGALSARFDGERIGLTGTLAADRLTLPDPSSTFGPMLTPAGLWSGEALRLSELSGADLDLRLSASSARIGALRLDDLAANVLVKSGRIELSIGRATVNRGQVKGRVIAAPATQGQDLKLQGSFDRLDLSAFLADLGQTRWISGLAQGHVVLDATGESLAELARQVQGRAVVTVRQGELWGVALNDALRKAERRPLSTTLEWRGGRTPFDQAQIVANLHAGVGDIVEGHVMSPPTRTALQGRILVADRSLAVKALVEAASAASGFAPGASLAFEISGPWNDVTFAPDVPSLIQRSRAARQLFGPEPRGEEPDEPRPATKPASD